MRLLYALSVTVAISFPLSAQVEGLQRGDVVRMEDPRWSSIVRQVIAVPGDRVMMTETGEVYVNDSLIDVPQEAVAAHRPFGPAVVQKGGYIVIPLTDSDTGWGWGYALERYIVERIG
ncbi:MAG: hypothetical protein IH939_09825 [Acidobacteria bacterium]|nr:hypothetical protein [Acidobacteriota bacterium]